MTRSKRYDERWTVPVLFYRVTTLEDATHLVCVGKETGHQEYWRLHRRNEGLPAIGEAVPMERTSKTTLRRHGISGDGLLFTDPAKAMDAFDRLDRITQHRKQEIDRIHHMAAAQHAVEVAKIDAANGDAMQVGTRWKEGGQ